MPDHITAALWKKLGETSAKPGRVCTNIVEPQSIRDYLFISNSGMFKTKLSAEGADKQSEVRQAV